MIADTVNALAFLLIFPWAGLTFVAGAFAHKGWVALKKDGEK